MDFPTPPLPDAIAIIQSGGKIDNEKDCRPAQTSIMSPHLNGLFLHLFGEYFDMVNKSEKGYHLSKYNRLETRTKSHYRKWRDYMNQSSREIPLDSSLYAGIDFNDLPKFEDCFEVSVSVFCLNPDMSTTRMYVSMEWEAIYA